MSTVKGILDNWLYQLSNELSDQKTYIEVSDAYVRSHHSAVFKGLQYFAEFEILRLMYTYDPFDNLASIPKYVYAQDVTVTTVQGRDFKVDFAFTPQSGIPLYVHATEIDKETASLPDNEAFMDIAGASLTMYFYCSDMRYSETEFDKIFKISTIAVMSPATAAPIMVLMKRFHACRTSFSPPSSAKTTPCATRNGPLSCSPVFPTRRSTSGTAFFMT